MISFRLRVFNLYATKSITFWKCLKHKTCWDWTVTYLLLVYFILGFKSTDFKNANSLSTGHMSGVYGLGNKTGTLMDRKKDITAFDLWYVALSISKRHVFLQLKSSSSKAPMNSLKKPVLKKSKKKGTATQFIILMPNKAIVPTTFRKKNFTPRPTAGAGLIRPRCRKERGRASRPRFSSYWP